MKRSLLALAALTAFAGVASAQSTVTLSGSVDMAVQRTNDAWNMSTGNSGRSAFTLSGKEDLGGGMSAIFLMNHRFNPGTGAITSPNFWRQAWVGLGGGFGTVRMGRMLPVLQTFNGDFDPFGTETIGSTHTGGFNAGLAGSARLNNAIYYQSPSMGGLSLHANIAAADGNLNAAAANAPERPMGLGVNYAAGPVRVALAYDTGATDLKTIGLYGSYNAGFGTLMAQFERGDTSPTTDQTAYSIGARVPMGAATIKAGFRNNSDANQKKIGLGLDYSLSKRTIVYTDVAKQSGNGFSATAKKAQFDVGVWHKF